MISFLEAENRLLIGGCRKKCLSILKALRDSHLDLPGKGNCNEILSVTVIVRVP